jgi:hypothetical protein
MHVHPLAKALRLNTTLKSLNLADKGVGRQEEGEGGEAGEGGMCGDGREGRQKEGGQSVRGGVEGHGVTCGDAWQVLAGNGWERGLDTKGFRHCAKGLS